MWSSLETAGERGGQPSRGAVVQCLGQVEETAPALRVLQRRDPAQSPGHGLRRVVEYVGAADGDRAAGGAPQGCVDPGVPEGLQERGRQHHADGQRLLLDPPLLVEADQGQHAGELLDAALPGRAAVHGGAQPVGQPGPVGVRRADGQQAGPRAGGLDRLDARLDVVRVLESLGYDHEPGAGQHGAGRLRLGPPGDAVAPAVDDVALLTSLAPGRQRGQHLAQRTGVLQTQRPGQTLQVLPLDGLPELDVHRVQHRGQLLGGTRGLQPVPLPLERVGGQCHRARRATREGRAPVDLDAGGPRLTQRGVEPGQTALTAPQRSGDHGGLQARVRECLLHRHRQHRVRAHLQEHRVPLTRQLPYRRLQSNRLTQVGEPVLRVERRVLDPCARHRREERHLRHVRGHRRENVQQLLTQRLHMGGVRRVVHLDPARPHPVRLARGHQLVQRVGVTAHHHRGGPVDRGDRDPAVPAGHQLARRALRQRHRHHPATAREHRDRPAPQRHHPRAIRQRQTAGDTCRRDLTLRVTDDRVRPHPEGLPQSGQRHHHRPQHRLHHIDPIEPRGTLDRPHHITQRPIDKATQRHLALGEPSREHRRGVQQFDRHPHPLRTLTREDEHRPAQRTRRDTRHGEVPVDQHRAVLEGRPGRQQRPAHVGRVENGLPHMDRQPVHLLPQRVGRPGRHHPRHHRAVRDGLRGPLRLRLGFRLFEDYVGVGAAHAERRDAGAARPVGLRPRAGPRQQFHGARGPVHVRRRLVQVQGPRQHTVPHGHDHLDHAGHAGSGLGVTDVRLDRAQPQRPVGGPVLAVGRQQRLRLDRVTQRRTGAVRLDRVHIGGRPVRRSPGPRGSPAAGRGRSGAVRPLLAPSWLIAEPVTTASTWWPLRTSVRQPLQQQHADALGHAHAVGRRRRTACTGRSAARPRCRLKPTQPDRRRPSRRRRPRARVSTRPTAAPAPPGAAPPATTSTPVSIVTAGPSSPRVYAMRPDSDAGTRAGDQMSFEPAGGLEAACRSPS